MRGLHKIATIAAACAFACATPPPASSTYAGPPVPEPSLELRSPLDTEKAARATVDEARMAASQRHPEAPELGATHAEARVICLRQLGSFEVKTIDAAKQPDPMNEIGVCRVGGLTIFVCATDKRGRFWHVRVARYGADWTTERRELEERYGPGREMGLDSHGFRVFEWSAPGLIVQASMFDRGVTETREIPPPP